MSPLAGENGGGVRVWKHALSPAIPMFFFRRVGAFNAGFVSRRTLRIVIGQSQTIWHGVSPKVEIPCAL